NLTKTVAVADTLNFAASSTQTITNAMTLQGAASNLLALRSTASGTQWNINPQGSRLVAYLDVKDSNNVNALFINAYGSNSVDSGNNIKWAFFPATLTQSDFGFYQNIDSLQPTTPLALQNATTTIYSTSSPVRLRMNVLAPDNYLPSAYQAFKLQVSTSTSVDWVDVGSLPPNPVWWNTSWLNRRKIAFSNASSTANLLNFPVLVSLTANNIDYAKTKASGADIRFVDADGVTPLSYEIEKWDASATSSLWVKVPQIDATSTTDFIWMYYNNSSATNNSTTTGVWDDSFKGVWHLKETTGTTIYDSTQYVNTGTKVSASEPAATSTSQIAGAQYFDGSNDYVYTADSFVNPTNVTLGTWFKTTTTSGRKLFGLESNQTGTGSASYDRHLYMGSNGRIYFGAYSGSIKTAMSTSVLNDGGWHYASGILDSGSSQIRLYIDGVLNSTTSLGAVGAYTGYFRMGSYKLNTWTNGGDGYYNGYLDEVRLSTTTRSADWILAEYKTGTNQYNTYFAEEGAGGAPDSLATWQFYNNPSVASGSVISAILLSTSLVRGTYEESNPTTLNPFDVPVGRAIEYDFAINPQSMLADTLYYFRLVQDSGLPLGVYSNYPALMYTYVPDPNPPTGFTATVDSATQISLAWSENGNTSTVQYLAENLTNSTNSGWISATATSFSGLACASTYSFTVKARNMIGVESSTVSQTATTPACGLPSGTGGSGVSSFSTRAFCLVVNGDAVTTNSSRVTLDISTDAQGVTQIELADNPLFVGSQKLPYAATISDWNLCGGNASCPSGVYKVYAKLYNAAGEVSPTISDDINYEPIDVSSPVTVQFTTDAAFGLPSDADVAVGVSLSHATTVPVAVDYAHIGGTAVLGTDYQFTPGTLVIPSGQTAASINFRVASWTAGGTIVLGLANSTLASLGEITQFTYTILGNAPTSTEGEILLSSPGALSNNSSTSYTIWLSKAPTQDVTVAISTDGQTNAAPADLVFSPANWNIPQSVGLVQTINATSTSYGTVDHTAQSQDPAYRYVTKSLVVVLGSADSFCQQNPTDPTCSFCALNPTDPACAFCVLNPQDPSCTVSDPYCKLYPTDPACTDFCQVDPTDPACAYCALHPSDSQCQTQNCQTNPTDPACAFCQLYPQDAACTDTKTYCQLHPTDSKCQDPVCADPVSVACVCHVDPKDPACATYCQQNPASPDCQFCYINPTDPSCSSFCSLHPQNPTCQDNYCALNPADSKCVAAFCTLYPTDPLCQGSVCQQNPANPACTFCSLYPQDPACQQVDCTTNPNSPACAYCTLKPIDPTCLSYCQNHPADPACVVVEPYCNLHPEDPVCKSDECKTNPTTPACAYCVLHPEDTNCQSVSCQQNPTLQACQFCTLYPEDQKCKESVCTINPSDPACQTPYCELHPEDSACKTEACKANPNLPGCTFCALHPEDPVCAPSICQQNPTDPSCPPTGESFCKLHPDDQKCKKDFCILNPADSLCQPGYCESHPFDGACLTKETNKKLTELINTVTTVVDDSKDIAQQGLEKLPGNTSTAFSLAAFSSLVVAPVITAGRLSMPVYGLINGMTGAVDLWLWLIRLWYWLLGALGFRRRRKVWGTVYDSASKQPLDPVMVSLVDDRTKEVVDQSITDMAGRYGFLDRSGTFTIGAQKTNYQFPSKRIAGKSDEIYDNLYYGEAFTITNVGSSVVAPNIPMDPLAFDWNQMDKQRIIKLHPKLEHLKNLLFSLLFYSGFVFTALLVLVLPSALHIIFLAFYLVIILVRCLVPSQKLWGQVYMKDGTQLMSGMVLELV
ncbi:MAG: DUF2341 domain-containing protein, partial [Patescibacteria group bacterium]|nr:DUF2341 domain-containing protein [Patescibacteria group bacterium]